MSNRIVNDPRIDPRLKAMFAEASPPHLPDMESREALLAAVGKTLGSQAGKPDNAPYEATAPSRGLVIGDQAVLSQPDGNSINLQIIKPEGTGPFACVYYIHGGGMMMGSCYEPNLRAWGRLIASCGVAVVMVDFRNAVLPSSVPEIAPFPAGLNDCVSGLRWVHENAARLNIDPLRIVIAGESGGGNLSLAVALKLKRDGDLSRVSGIYVMCPYLAGEWKGAPGSSALENAGILMEARSNYGPMAYGIEQLYARNPLAWPGFATAEDVRGFPPVIVNVNECDPLRDDGIKFYRLLLSAGVQARCRQLMGTVHATEIMVLPCPDISRGAARDLASFCMQG